MKARPIVDGKSIALGFCGSDVERPRRASVSLVVVPSFGLRIIHPLCRILDVREFLDYPSQTQSSFLKGKTEDPSVSARLSEALAGKGSHVCVDLLRVSPSGWRHSNHPGIAALEVARKNDAYWLQCQEVRRG